MAPNLAEQAPLPERDSVNTAEEGQPSTSTPRGKKKRPSTEFTTFIPHRITRSMGPVSPKVNPLVLIPVPVSQEPGTGSMENV